jgi:hypothetical protein
MSERVVDAIARAWWELEGVGLPPWAKLSDAVRDETRFHAERWLRAIDDAGFFVVEAGDGR